jgi:hypothetical protein
MDCSSEDRRPGHVTWSDPANKPFQQHPTISRVLKTADSRKTAPMTRLLDRNSQRTFKQSPANLTYQDQINCISPYRHQYLAYSITLPNNPSSFHISFRNAEVGAGEVFTTDVTLNELYAQNNSRKQSPDLMEPHLPLNDHVSCFSGGSNLESNAPRSWTKGCG